MSGFFNTNAEPVIFDLKQSIDDICEKYIDSSLLDYIDYAGKEYGVMQRAELEVIMDALLHLKKHVDGLLDDCLTESPRCGVYGRAAPETGDSRRISLSEMLEAMEG